VEIFIERSNSSINYEFKVGNLLIFGLILIGLMVIFSYGMGNVSATGNTIYVNGSGGQDTSDGSSWLLAKKSIKNATGTVNNGGTVNIANGQYTGTDNTNITITKNMDIIGQSQKGTIINGTGTNWIFHINSAITLNIWNLTLTNATTPYGGAIENGGGTLTVKGCTFNCNNASDGGAINNDGGTVTVTGSTFTGNKADNNGAINNDGGILTVTDSTFTGNIVTSGNGGGAIFNNNILTVKGSTFTSNTATNNGGAIINGGTMSVTSSTFTNNSANAGGAIENYGGTSTTPVTISGSTFNGNTATKYGGAIYNSGTANVHFNRIIGNTAATGSAIYNNVGTVDVSLNWWGDNTGPTGKISGLTANNWLVLILTTVPSSVQLNSYSHIIADLRYDNLGIIHTEGYLPNGTYSKVTTSFGTLINTSSTINGIIRSYLKSSSTGTANVSIKLDNQTITKSVKIIDTIPPKVTSTTPKNNSIKVSKTIIIIIKFSENIKTSTYFNNMTIKNLSTNRNLVLSRSISGNTLIIKTSTKNANTVYQITIPKAAIKDYAGNNLQTNYTFKFKTGT
jgi:autotransporter family porin